MDVEKYMQKYAKIAGLEKTAVSKKLGKKPNLGSIPRNLMGGVEKKNTDPGYLFLNSGKFAKIMIPRPPRRTAKQQQEKKEQLIKDMFGRIVGSKDIFD